MHQVINDILESTRRRVTHLHITDTRRKTGHRDIISSIQRQKCKNKIPVIAEVKPGSPTTEKREITPNDASKIALEMEAGGAVAISVLTEPDFFYGRIENLYAVRKSVRIPVLRKDFIIDEKQIYETESDLILLISGILGDNLKRFVNLSLEYGLEPLVEVHNEKELMDALNTETMIIGINNRNLTTLTIDLSTTEHLIPLIPDDRIIISESGIKDATDAARVINSGADAVLVGTAVMDAPFDRTKELVDAL